MSDGRGAVGSDPLRIGIVAPPFYEVPPRAYGGTELVCGILVDGLVERGHEVTLVAAGESRTRARVVRTFGETQPEGTDEDVSIEIVHAARAAAALEELDVDLVHDHTRAGPLTARGRAAPTLVTVHAIVSGPDSQADSFRAVGRWCGLVALSESQRRSAPDLNWIGVVHNGVPPEEYPFREHKEDFVLFLGRMAAHKAPHVAVDVARIAGRRIVLAGGWTIPSEQIYFEKFVRPRLGPEAEWVGEVGPDAKKDLLSRAACLVFPAQWEEPFGLVLVEAMACGTPAAALRAGAVAELLLDGETGILCGSTDELPAAIEAASALDPSACRAHVARSLSADRMVEGYETLYRRLLNPA